MPKTRFIPPEGPRYGTSLVFLPALWTGVEIWEPAGTYLAHRGWEGRILDLRDVRGGFAARVEVAAEAMSALPAPGVVLGHDVGAIVALALSRRTAIRAAVVVSPIVPASSGARALLSSATLVWRLLTGGGARPPSGGAAGRVLEELSAELRRSLADEDPRLLVEMLRGRAPAVRGAPMPTLVVHGTADPLLSQAEAVAFAERLHADVARVEGAAHYPIVGPAWRSCVGQVHRWLVRSLEASLLELYADAMAERDEDDPAGGE